MAAVQLTVSAFDAMMKEIYPDIRVESLATRKRPLLEWLPRKDDFYGDTYVVPVLYEDPQGRSASLSKAIAGAETSKQTKFVVTERKKDYAAVQIEAEAIMAASRSVGAFIEAKDTQISGKIRNLGKSLHLAMYRSGSGSLGKVATGGLNADSPSAGETTITLENKSDVYNFGEGQTLVANNTDDATSVKEDGSNQVKVIALNHADGEIVVDKDVVNDLSTAWAAGDFLFTAGDPDEKVTGLAGWLPLSAPTSGDSFFSVDRSTNVAALSGHRVNNTGRSILENAEELALFIGEFGGEPDALFMNPRAGRQLAAQVGAEVTRKDGGKARVGFSGFTLEHFITGPIDVRFDIGCPPDRAYMLQRDTWRFAHMGAVPHIIRDDGRDSLRSSDGSYDGIEVRARYFGELTCKAPGYNGVMAVATS